MQLTFWAYLTQNPTILLTWLVYGVGVFLSVLHSRKNLKKYTLTLAAFMIFLLESIVNTLFFLWSTDFDSFAQQAQFLQAYSCLSTVFWLAGWICLLLALFPQASGAGETGFSDTLRHPYND